MNRTGQLTVNRFGFDAIEVTCVGSEVVLRRAEGRWPNGESFAVEALRIRIDAAPDGGVPVLLRDAPLRLALAPEEGGLLAARVAFDANEPTGALKLHPELVPAVTHIGVWPPLVERLRTLQRAMTRRKKALAQLVVGAEDPTAGDLAFLSLVAGELPRLAHMVEHGVTSPEALFLALARLEAASSAIVAPREEAPEPRVFDINALGETLLPMLTGLVSVIGGPITPYQYAVVPLDKRDDGMYLGRFDEGTGDARDRRFFVEVQGGSMEERQSVARHLKIGDWAAMGELVHSTAPGVPTRWADKLPRDLVFFFGKPVLVLDLESDAWKAVVATGTIALYQPVNNGAISLRLLSVRTT